MILGVVGCNSSTNEKVASENFNIGLLTLDNSQKTGLSDLDRVNEQEKNDKDCDWVSKSEEKKEIEKNFKFIHYDNLTSALLGLDRKDITSLNIPRPVCDYIMSKNKDKYACFNLGKKHMVLVMAAMNDKQEVIDEINKGLRAIMSNRKYDDIYKKYIIYVNTDSDEKLPHFDDAKTIRVAVTGDLPPFDYMNAAGEAQGFNVALLSAIADEIHINFELVNCDSSARAITTSTGKADVIFWMSGDSIDENGTNIDYSNDVPENMIVSDRYAIVPFASLRLTSEVKPKN